MLPNKRLQWMALTTLAASVVVTLAVGAAPTDFEIMRPTIDGGGVMSSSGGELKLSGTLGQPDSGMMEGGGFTLSGGFWFGLPTTDCNDDGLVSLLDNEVFEACMMGPGSGIGASPCPCFDVDRDGHVTLNDYAQLQARFTGQ